MNREEKDWLTENVNSNTYLKSAVPLQGWRFDFSDVLRTFLVCQYGRWTEYKACLLYTSYDFELGGKGYLGDKWSYGGGVAYGYSLPVGHRFNVDFIIQHFRKDHL